jgi:nucleoside-diphosphate kinase
MHPPTVMEPRLFVAPLFLVAILRGVPARDEAVVTRSTTYRFDVTMSQVQADRYCFTVEYLDQQAGLVREYKLLYFPADKSIEMYDLKTRRVFLKRCPYPTLLPRDLFIGATATIFSRTLTVTDYGDEITRRLFASQTDRAVISIGGGALYQVGNLLKAIMASDVRVANICLASFSPAQASALNSKFQRCYVMECVGGDIGRHASKWTSLAPGNVFVSTEPQDIEAYRKNAFEGGACTATMSSCAVCIVKPHAVNEHAGTVVQRIMDEGFEITALGAFSMSRADAEDLLEVYAGVLPEHKALVDEMASGQCWAMELRAENSVQALRAVCGPHDPEICRVLYPNTIRGELGIDRVRNAVHCTDLPEDGPLESEFFFKLLANK